VFAKIGEGLKQNRLRYLVQETIIDNNMMGATPDTTRVDSRFFFYSLSQFDFAEVAGGTALPYLTVSALSSLTLKLPPLPEQRAIAHVVGALDDKIELNRRTNETLEAIAQAIFKSWFVDFDPARAKMEGRRPFGMDAATAALFPDSFVDSPLGGIPKGWRVGTLGELADVTSGKRPDERVSQSMPEAGVPLWGGNGPMAYVREPLFSQPILLTGRVGTLGSVFRITSPCWPSDNTLVVLPKEPIAYQYLFFQMWRIDFDALNRGSTQPLLTQTDLKAQTIPTPPRTVLQEFHKNAGGLFNRIDRAEEESRTLAAIRDALLPKLISGEMRVRDAERFLKERGL